MSMYELTRRIDNLQSVVMNMFRVGVVTEVEDKSRVRVKFEDRDDLPSYSLQVIQLNSKDNKDYWLPDIDEPVLCLFLPIGIEQGFVVGAYYPDTLTSPETSKDVRSVTFKDGTAVRYDRESHTLTVDVSPDGGNVVVNAQTQVTVNSPVIHLGENADLEPSVLGDKLAEWISDELKPWLDSHVHPAGTPMTGTAQSGSTGPFEEGSGAQGGAVYSTKNKNQ